MAIAGRAGPGGWGGLAVDWTAIASKIGTMGRAAQAVLDHWTTGASQGQLVRWLSGWLHRSGPWLPCHDASVPTAQRPAPPTMPTRRS